jgi:hypothetical protein
MPQLPDWLKKLIVEEVRAIVRAELQKHGVPVAPETRTPPRP